MAQSAAQAVVQAFYAALAQKQTDPSVYLTAFFSADARWCLPRTSPLHDKLQGPEAIAGLFSGAVDSYYRPESMRYDYHAQLADETHVMMQFTLSATTANGKDYENDYCLLYRVEDGLIAEVKEFFDTALLFDLMPEVRDNA